MKQKYEIPLKLFDCSKEEVKENYGYIDNCRRKILFVLSLLGFLTETESYCVGPTVITYDVIIPDGVSPEKFMDYQSDISLGIKGRARCYLNKAKGVFCVEVPRMTAEAVTLGEVIKCCADMLSDEALTIILGRNTKNEIVTCDLTKLANVFVAGGEVKGKCSFLDTLITTLVYNHSPNDLKFILISHNEIKFETFSGLPHLATKPVSDAPEILVALSRVLEEMENRYDLFSKTIVDGNNITNVRQYNKHVDAGQKLPEIVVVIDEFDELFYCCGGELRDMIIKLTQKASAAGIYLVVSTQCVSKWIIRSSILENFAARVAFRTSSPLDSYVVLNNYESDSLYYDGDFLYLIPGVDGVRRARLPYVSMSNVKRVVDYIKANYKAYDGKEKTSPDYDSTKDETAYKIESCYVSALRAVIEAGQVSVSMIQRKCRVGYNKASLIIQWMEENHYVSVLNKERRRKVLITMEDFNKKFG